MPRIPDATALDRVVPRSRSQSYVDNSSEIAGEAAQRLVGTISKVADYVDEKDQQLARAKDANSFLDHQLATKQLAQTYKDKIATGEIPYAEAQKNFEDDARKLKAPEPQARGAVAAENLHHAVELNINGATFDIGQAAGVAREKDLQSQGAAQLDSLGKLAGMPGANIESINEQAGKVEPLLRTAGLNPAQASKVVQDFKDKNWQNQAVQRSIEAKDNLGAIKTLEKDLTDGFYIGKLDTDKRNAVLAQVRNNRLQIEYRMQHEQDKREVKAERALNQIDQQIASGVPATAQMWNEWSALTKGTPAEVEFKTRIADEAQVQETLRKPIKDQIAFVQSREEQLKQGGNLRDVANFNRLQTAVKANVTQLQTNPLLFNANRNGQDVAPVDFSMLEDPQTSAQFADRIATLNTMRKQYGTPIKPLLPQEAQQLAGALNDATPREQADLFAGLRTSINDSAAYAAAMQQIAPDAPVKAMAGMLSAKQAELTTGTHWFKPDDKIASKDVAAIMLRGEELLNPSKADKAGDGKPKLGLYLPEQNTLQADFMAAVGSAFAERPGAAEIAFQAARAYYVGRAAQTGRMASSNKDIDTALVKEAITNTLGGVTNFNGAGEVLMPWGMTKDQFDDRAADALRVKAQELGLSSRNNPLAGLGLRNQGDGTYFVMAGRNYALDSKGQPVVIALKPETTAEAEKPVVLRDVNVPTLDAARATMRGTR